MATNLELTRKVLAETDRTSRYHIWTDLIKPRLPQARKRTTLPGAASRGLIKSNNMHGLDRAEEVMNLFQAKNTRASIGHAVKSPGGSALWKLILEAVDAGFATPNSANINMHRKLSPRILFPHTTLLGSSSFIVSYDLSIPRQLDIFKRTIWPVALANREALIADPNRLQEFVEKARREQHGQVVEQRAVAKVAALPSREQEIIMYGLRLWPVVDGSTHTYDQARAACWSFNDINRLCELSKAHGDDARARGQQIRFSTRWYSQFVDRAVTDLESRHAINGVYALVHAISFAMEKNPDGEIKSPMRPYSEGKWA